MGSSPASTHKVHLEQRAQAALVLLARAPADLALRRGETHPSTSSGLAVDSDPSSEIDQCDQNSHVLKNFQTLFKVRPYLTRRRI